MQLKINSLLILGFFIGLGLLVILCVRGCHEGRAAVTENELLRKKNDSLQKATIMLKKIGDSSKAEYQDSLSFVNAQLSLRDNQLTARIIQLDSADKRITTLLAKYKSIQPATDTSVTVVPNEYVTNCADCFGELANGQEKVKQYMAQIDNLNQTYKAKISVQENRINFLDKQSSTYAEMLQNCISDSKKAQEQLKPKGLLFVTMGVLWQPWPKGASAGVTYQNKYRVQFGAKYYWTSYGNMVETQMSLPLSFKKFKL